MPGVWIVSLNESTYRDWCVSPGKILRKYGKRVKTVHCVVRHRKHAESYEVDHIEEALQLARKLGYGWNVYRAADGVALSFTPSHPVSYWYLDCADSST